MRKVASVVPKTIPEASDVIFHFSTTETYKSFRSPTILNNGKKIGSFFVYALTKEISKLSENDTIEIHQLLVRVNGKVAVFATKKPNKDGTIADGDFGQIPEIRSTMREEFYLSKKNNQLVKRKRTVKYFLRKFKEMASSTIDNAAEKMSTNIDKRMLKKD